MLPALDFLILYSQFDTPIVERLDCGEKCAPHNPKGVPFCCDICEAVPAAYHQEWEYLQPNTNLWHRWRGDECSSKPEDPTQLEADTPETMVLLACLGADQCQRPYRALSCRQFPFFPYITDDFRFLGLTYEWEFEHKCWLISNLHRVSNTYRQEFIQTFDDLFSHWPQEMEHYANQAEHMREVFSAKRRRIPILHRNGGCYLLSPGSERIRRVCLEKLAKFGVYR